MNAIGTYPEMIAGQWGRQFECRLAWLWSLVILAPIAHRERCTTHCMEMRSRPVTATRKALFGLMALAICLLAGCVNLEPERLVKLHDTEQSRPAAYKTLFFLPSHGPWVPGDDSSRWGPDTQSVEVPLDANGEARIRLRKVSWWARLEEDHTTYGTTVDPSGLQHGGMFQLYARSRSSYDTNLYPSKFVLTITKP